MKLSDRFYTELMISFDEIKDVCDPVSIEQMVRFTVFFGGGGELQLFSNCVSLCYEALWTFSNRTDG